MYDLHTHTQFSDGSSLESMVTAAADAGCTGIGLADHCILVDDDFSRRERYDLAETYERRRERIDDARDRFDLRLFDAVELSYVRGTDDQIGAFLEEAAFDYSIGAVHFAEAYDYATGAPYAECPPADRREAVDTYYETVIELIESELFDIAAHLDLPERHPQLRGVTTAAHYEALAAALADSRTKPEINAGRVFRSLGRVHPNPELLDVFVDREIEFVLGSDSHTPDEIGRRVPFLEQFVETNQAVTVDAPAFLETTTELRS
ncbi:PHP domain-containing protein [Natronorubrum tibetense]|uniref:histidinol-phosphatase n=1 Tax=Natronorubrum tibetense GA33 TaxID=1114856 RepID=L9W0F6_9EURY|nr:PHP domain-containing protein [Natronorubrum tibetense]ELY41803.1 PHP domain-containing protein [Natronorubrum tibetense GA33]